MVAKMNASRVASRRALEEHSDHHLRVRGWLRGVNVGLNTACLHRKSRGASAASLVVQIELHWGILTIHDHHCCLPRRGVLESGNSHASSCIRLNAPHTWPQISREVPHQVIRHLLYDSPSTEYSARVRNYVRITEVAEVIWAA